MTGGTGHQPNQRRTSRGVDIVRYGISHRARRGAALLASVGLIVTACSGGATPAPSAAAGSPGASAASSPRSPAPIARGRGGRRREYRRLGQHRRRVERRQRPQVRGIRLPVRPQAVLRRHRRHDQLHQHPGHQRGPDDRRGLGQPAGRRRPARPGQGRRARQAGRAQAARGHPRRPGLRGRHARRLGAAGRRQAVRGVLQGLDQGPDLVRPQGLQGRRPDELG